MLAASLAAAVEAGAGACARPSAPSPATPVGTERWLDAPSRLHAASSAAPVAAGAGSSRFWNAARIEQEWSRSSSGGRLTLVSPRLDFAGPDEVDSIVVRFSDLGGLQRFALAWGPEPRLDPKAELRNTRELSVIGDPPQRAFRVLGDEIAYTPLLRGEPGRDTFRHLLLRLPSVRPAPSLESVSVISKRDVLSAQPFGPVRHTFRGETRSAYHLAAPASLAYETRVEAGAVLHFGVLSLEPGSQVRCTLALRSAGRERVLLEQRVPEAGRAWRDFQVALPAAAAGPVSFLLSLASDAPHDRLLVSNPTLVAPPRTPTQPNVILYVIDSLRADRLGFAGYARDTTPFLDSLAMSGLVFRNAYAQAAWTKPAVTSLLTSLHPQTHGVGASSSLDVLPESVTTLQDAMRAHGYLTAQFAANAFASRLSNLDQGFDWVFGPEAFELRDPDRKRGKPRSDDVHARLLPWLLAHAGAPFFAYVHSIDPHPPCAAVQPARAVPAGASESDLCDEELRFNDGQLRALAAALDARGLLERTLLVVTADHGEAFGEHGQRGHGLSVHEPELRIPLLFWSRGRLAARAVEETARAVDVMPTLLRLAGVPFDTAALQGRDLLGGSARMPVFAARFVYPEARDLPEFFEREQWAVVDGRTKLVLRQRGRAEPERALYDLEADPGERSDRSALEPARARQLEGALSEFLAGQQAARRAFLRAHGDAAGAAAARAPLPQDALERLRSLGYLK